MTDAPWHAHVYYSGAERAKAAKLREKLRAEPAILFIGRMVDGPVGPHPSPQYEIHFLEPARDAVIALIEPSGLRALIHPLTLDDLADHTTLGHWIGEPLELDTAVLDPFGVNRGIARFGVSDF